MRDRGGRAVRIDRSDAAPPEPRTAPTSAADEGIWVWPQCAECTMRRGGEWTPVEEYGVTEEKPGMLSLKTAMVVKAACSHGHGFLASHVQRQSARIDVPYYWGDAQRVKAVQSLVFFRPGQPTENRMLV